MKNNNIKEALIGDAGKDTSRNIKVVITLSSSLPFITLSQSSGPGTNVDDVSDVATITYNSGVAKMPIVKREPKNLLVDIDNPDRYLFVGIMSSYIQSIEMDVYFDTEEKHMFCIPSLIDLGDTAKSMDFLKNKEVKLEGYGLGVNGGVNINSSCSATYNYCRLTNDVSPVDTALNLLRVPGKTGSALGGQGLLLGGGDIYVEGTKSLPSEFISFGGTDALGTKVPAWKYVRTAINTMSLYYVGTVDLDDVLVPLPL